MTTYATIRDFETYEVIPALDCPEDFDTLQIAREASEYVDGEFVVAVDEDTFWDIVKNNRI